MTKITKPGGKKPAKKNVVKEKAVTEVPTVEEELAKDVAVEVKRVTGRDVMPVTHVVKRETRAVEIATMEDLTTFSRAVAKSGMFPGIEDEFQALSVIELGREIGLKPIISLQVIDVIPTKRGGVLAIEGRALAALAKESGINIEIIQKDINGCKLKFSRGNEPAHVASFTRDDAKRAGLLSKDNYMKYPEDMFYWRAIARGVKVFDPGLALGINTVEEIDDMPIAKGTIADKKEEPEKPTVKITKSKTQPLPEVEAAPDPEPPPEEVKEPENPEYAIEFENTIKDIKMTLERTEIKESLFKKYLGEELQPLKPEREFVQHNEWGHWSFHKGKLKDLKVIIEHFDWMSNQYFESITFKESTKETPTDPI